MTGNRFVRFGQLQHSDPKFGRLIAISLALHVVLLLAFQLGLGSRFTPPKKTVYYVDLSQLPVKSPRAGRPSPPAPKVKTPPPASRKPAAAKSTAQSPPKTESAKIPRSDTTKAAIEKLRAEKIRSSKEQALRDKLAALSAEDTREATPAAASDAPLGSVSGQGDEIGPSQREWLNARLKELWNLSRYQVESLDLQAELELEFSPTGQLLHYRFLERSGSSRFDDSLVRVMLKLKDLELPFSFERRTRLRTIFNLKDLIR